MTLFFRSLHNWMLITFLSITLLVPILVAAAETTSQGPVSTSRLGNTAIGGYDSVAYHDPSAISTHTAIEGSKKWVFEWRGATWRFASEQSYNAFKADPEKYRPAYGGFCSNALSLGEGLIRTDGAHWEILDGRLHLFFAARGRDRWLDGNHTQYRQQADKAWKEITGYDDQ